jgi:hypothetical protein
VKAAQAAMTTMRRSRDSMEAPDSQLNASGVPCLSKRTSENTRRFLQSD